MKDTFCALLQIWARVPIEGFDKSAFLDDTKNARLEGSPDDEARVYAWSYGSRDNPGEQHAHMFVDLRGKKNVRLTITFHKDDNGAEPVKDVRPPFMEDCVKWIGGFIRLEEVETTTNAVFDFGTGFEPVTALPFPLTTSVKELAGTVVTGLTLTMPSGMPIKGAVMNKNDDSIVVIGLTSGMLSLREFDFDGHLNTIAASVRTLVKSKDGEPK